MPAAGKKKRRSWAEAAGRSSGKEGYKFGDLTRTCVGVIRRNSGDLNRVAVSNLFGDKHRERGAEGSAGMGTMPRPEPLLTSTAELHRAGAPSQGSLLDGVWVGFFNAAYAVGRLALLAGELRVEDIDDSEPAVLIGLPTLAMLECAIRSAAMAGDHQLVTFEGKTVGNRAMTALAAGGSALGVDALGLFNDMVALALRIRVCRLSPAGLATLRARALAADGAAGAALAPDEDQDVNSLVARAQSVGVRMSQMEVYRHSFDRVLRALSEERRHETDAIKMLEGL